MQLTFLYSFFICIDQVVEGEELHLCAPADADKKRSEVLKCVPPVSSERVVELDEIRILCCSDTINAPSSMPKPLLKKTTFGLLVAGQL